VEVTVCNRLVVEVMVAVMVDTIKEETEPVEVVGLGGAAPGPVPGGRAVVAKDAS